MNPNLTFNDKMSLLLKEYDTRVASVRRHLGDYSFLNQESAEYKKAVDAVNSTMNKVWRLKEAWG